MNKQNIVVVMAILLVLTISCSIMKGKEIAEPAVEKFHTQFNAKQFSEIYNDASDEFKKTVTEKDFTELLEAIHRKLGTVAKSTNSSWHVNTTTSGSFATLSCDVDFSEGKGTEQFVFLIKDDKALLYNYNVNSPLLITK